MIHVILMIFLISGKCHGNQLNQKNHSSDEWLSFHRQIMLKMQKLVRIGLCLVGFITTLCCKKNDHLYVPLLNSPLRAEISRIADSVELNGDTSCILQVFNTQNTCNGIEYVVATAPAIQRTFLNSPIAGYSEINNHLVLFYNGLPFFSNKSKDEYDAFAKKYFTDNGVFAKYGIATTGEEEYRVYKSYTFGILLRGDSLISFRPRNNYFYSISTVCE